MVATVRDVPTPVSCAVCGLPLYGPHHREGDLCTGCWEAKETYDAARRWRRRHEAFGSRGGG